MRARSVLVDAACLALGAASALWLTQWRPPLPSRVTAAASAARVVLAAPQKPAPLQTPVLQPTLQPQKPQSEPARRRQSAAETAPQPRKTEPAQPERITPPPIVEREVPARAELPAQPDLELPPRPDSIPVLPIPDGVVPGGNAVVVGVRVNDAGRAEDTLILVPSRDPFFDLAVVLHAMQTTFGPLNPPLAPGEARWIAITLYKQEPAPSVLP